MQVLTFELSIHIDYWYNVHSRYTFRHCAAWLGMHHCSPAAAATFLWLFKKVTNFCALTGSWEYFVSMYLRNSALLRELSPSTSIICHILECFWPYKPTNSAWEMEPLPSASTSVKRPSTTFLSSACS